MNIIVAMCKNRGIGINGMIPWTLKEDMQFFKNKTIGNGNNAVIMGRKTYESIPNGLPKRKNYVISTTKSNPNGDSKAIIYKDIITANYDIVSREHRYEKIWVIGGQQIYQWYLSNNLIKDVYITRILEEYKCNTFFPLLPSTFYKIHSGDVVMSKENKIPYRIEVYRNNFYNSKNQDVLWCDFLKELDRIDYYGIF